MHSTLFIYRAMSDLFYPLFSCIRGRAGTKKVAQENVGRSRPITQMM